MDASAWDERYAAAELVWSATPNQFIEAQARDLTPGRALDLAAGEGRNALWLASWGWSVTAVDFSRVALDKGRKTQPDDADITWVCADATTYRAREMDLTVVAYLQLAAPERRASVRNGYAALIPGGTFLLVAHDSTNLTEGTGGPQSPEVLFTAEDVLADLDGERFHVVLAERVERQVRADDGHGGVAEHTAYDCLVRLVRTG
jgi:SAM-dependent methyltransferase